MKKILTTLTLGVLMMAPSMSWATNDNANTLQQLYQSIQEYMSLIENIKDIDLHDELNEYIGEAKGVVVAQVKKEMNIDADKLVSDAPAELTKVLSKPTQETVKQVRSYMDNLTVTNPSCPQKTREILDKANADKIVSSLNMSKFAKETSVKTNDDAQKVEEQQKATESQKDLQGRIAGIGTQMISGIGLQGETGRILSKMMEMQAKKNFPKPDLAGITTDPLTGKKDKSSGQNKEKTGDKK